MSKSSLILVDASGYIFRAHHAMVHTGLTSPDGKPTHVIMGVLNMLERLRKQYPDGLLVTVFDCKGKGVRVDWDANYKANRPPTPPELSEQIPPLLDIVKARGIPLVKEDNWEADDAIASLVREAKSKYSDIYVVTRDKDLAQLVDDKVRIIADDAKGELWDSKAVVEKYGVVPLQIPDYLSLIGDKVDNIPGVDKVGPKTAVEWISKFGSLQKIIDNAADIPGKVGENLRAAIPHLALTLKMNTLIHDAKLKTPLATLQQTAPDIGKLQKMYIELGLHKFLNELQIEDTTKREYKIILQQQEWDKLLSRLNKSSSFAFDLETDGLDHISSKIVGFAFALKKNEGFYVPCEHSYMGAPLQLKTADILRDIKPLFADKSKTIVAHNIKFDCHILANHGQEFPAYYDDTMLMSYVHNSSGRHNLTSLAENYLKYSKKDFTDLAGKGKKQLTFDLIEIDAAGDYAADDANACFCLHNIFNQKLKEEKQVQAVYEKIERPLVKILLEMERHGALLDIEQLRQQSQKLAKGMAEIEKKVFKQAGKIFNINSPAQLKTILFEEMGFTADKKTAGGQLSTAENVLADLAKEHEFPRLILDYRTLSKLKNTYTDTLPLLAKEGTNRVHTSFHQAVASTGRLSSVNPNLQNIPIRTAEGRNIRGAFIAPPGMVIASADYSQIELRIMAHLSGDKALLKAFEKGQDIHSATAAEVFGVKLEDVDQEQRRRSKMINFGLIYGMSAFGLAKQLLIGNKEAQDFIDLYFERYPGVKQYMEDTRASAAKLGWAETLSGRRVYLPQINSSNFAAKQGAVRAAINAPVQGSAADLIKLAMIKLQPQLKESDGEATMILQVHDELLFEIKEDALDKYKKIVCDVMESVAPLDTKLKVQLKVDFGYGANWKVAH